MRMCMQRPKIDFECLAFLSKSLLPLVSLYLLNLELTNSTKLAGWASFLGLVPLSLPLSAGTSHVPHYWLTKY